MEIMRDQYDFDATKSMYTKRFHAWEVRKNMTQEQKLSTYAHYRQHGGVTDDKVTIKGKPVSMSRILRPVQQKGQKMTIVAQELPNAMVNAASWDLQGPGMSSAFGNQVPSQKHDPRQTIAARTIQGIGTFQKQILQESPESSIAELILRHINYYYRRYSDNPRAVFHHTQSLGQVFGVIHEALNLLVDGGSGAYTKFHDACSGATALFRHQPFQITVQFSACFSLHKWSSYPEFRGALMRYLTGMANEVLGPDHYLPKILKLMLRDHTSTSLGSQVIRLTADTTLSRIRNSSTDLLDCMSYLSLLVSRMHRDTGEESTLLSKLSQDVLITNLLDGAATRDEFLVYRLGNLRLSQNRLDEAEELLTEAITLAGESPDAGGASTSKLCMLAFNGMGVLFGRRGDLNRRTEYYRLALEWSTKVVPKEALSKRDQPRRVQWLEDVVRYHTSKGHVLEVQSLREQHHDLWPELGRIKYGGLGRSGAGVGVRTWQYLSR
ncbi:hypothetical protein AYO21_00714 [Fonsecaea monophora]|uniref:Clr5 domain-containing protein n=1 Tax=Fonsecaea monophora TaxID=254056 RepID=A0A177FNT2_9EURO|nr:hypothetical protein AYO21_00714 [Fonsecaea monophora]OAG45366.1 hypothetical protein AYO21_00714 [Fonsecaea monophora]